jgi:cystathionine beta-lyase
MSNRKETICTRNFDENVSHSGLNTPIYTDSAYKYDSAADVKYPRYFNTSNHKSLAAKISALERTGDSLVFSSGMAAISTTLLTFLKSGDHAIFSSFIYGGTSNFIRKEFEKFGIEVSLVTGNTQSDFTRLIKPNTRLIYFESPANPLLNIFDLEMISEIALKNDLISIIDNTFATPINQTPYLHGIDLILHSGTKYLGGHSDLCFGTVSGSADHIQKIKESALNYGGSLNALDYYLIERSLKTLSVRVKQQKCCQ